MATSLFTFNLRSVRRERLAFRCGCVLWNWPDGRLGREKLCLKHFPVLRDGTGISQFAVVWPRRWRFLAKPGFFSEWRGTDGALLTTRRIALFYVRSQRRFFFHGCRVVEVR
jgi:hypothetical protein